MSSLELRVAMSVGRHFLTLSCIQYPPKDAPEKTFVFSGFLVDAGGVWFYVTAGHIIRDIETSLRQGATYDVWRLDDQTAGGRFSGKAVPFDFDVDRWIVVRDEMAGLDYAATAIEGLLRRQLEAGGALPIARAAWGTHLDQHRHWFIYGIPSQTVAYDGKTIITGKVVGMPLREALAPPMAGQKAENQFYAELIDLGGVTDIDGMSGGPVFSMNCVDGAWGYSVIGVQSAWYPSIYTVAACPIISFGTVLEEAVAKARSGAPNPPADDAT